MTLYYNGLAVNYGTGALGALTVNASTPGISGTTYNITAATAYYTNVTVTSGYTLKISRTTDFRVADTLTISGTVSNYDYGGGNNGVSPGKTSNGAGGGGGGSGSSGSGTSGGSGSSQGGGGGGTTFGNSTGGIVNWTDTIPSTYNGGNGGNGGWCNNIGNGGGGAYGAGSFKIIAKSIVINTGGWLQAAGDKGDKGSTKMVGSLSGESAGSGGGGGGGTIVIFADTISGSGNISASGGFGGDGTYISWSDNQNSTNGGAGGSGGNGRILFCTGVNSLSGGSINPAIANLSGGTILYDVTGPTIGTPVLSFPNGASQYQNQIVTVPISDSQTSVNTPSATFQTVSGTNSGTVSTSFSGGTATFIVSNQTGSGTAKLIISATDQAGNSTSVSSPTWTIDNTAPQNYVPFFGSGTTDWILDGTAAPSGLTLSGTTYTITAANDPTQSYSFDLKNLTIASTYYLKWRGSLTLKINGTATINGILGYGNYRSSTAPTGAIYGTISSGAGGNGGDGGGNNSTGGSGYGFTSAGVWTTVTSGGGGGGPNGGGGGGHAYRIPSATATRTAAISNGVSVGAGGGGGGGWNRGGGQASAGGGGLILYAQTLTGTGTVEVCGDAGKAGDRYDSSSSNPGPRESGGGGGGGGGGHIIAIIGTNNSSTLRFAAHGGAGGDYAWNNGYPTSNGLGGSGSSGYIQYYYSSGSTPLFALGPTSNAITTSATTFTLDTTIPATVSDNQPAATSALLTSSFRKNNESQTITIIYSKQMTNSEVKITITGAQSVTQTTMTAGTNNTYTYTHVNTTGDGVVNYSIVGKDILLNPAQTISGSWILDNTAPAITSSIAPSRAYFFPGETIAYSVAVTESNNLLTTPSMVINKGTGYAGPDPSAATLSLSSFDGTSVYGYQSSVQLPFGVGSINASVTATDVSGNSATTANLSPIKIIPPSGSFSY